MPILVEILKGLVVWMSREITQACCPEFFLRKLPTGFFLFNLFIFKEKQKHMQIQKTFRKNVSHTCTNLRQQRTFRKTYHTYVQIYVNKGHLEKRITHMYKCTPTKDI